MATSLKTEKLFQEVKVWREKGDLKTNFLPMAFLQTINPILLTLSLNGIFDIIEDEKETTETSKTYYIVRGKQVLGCIKLQF